MILFGSGRRGPARGARRASAVLAFAAWVAGLLLGVPPATATDAQFGPYTCKRGGVWREAFPGDVVCVTPARRTQTARENGLAAQRREPGGGPYGPDTCKQGFVWREARPADHVCIPVAGEGGFSENSRDAARRANDRAPFLYASPNAIPRGGVTVQTRKAAESRQLVASGGGLSPNGKVSFYGVFGNAVTPSFLLGGPLFADPGGVLGTQRFYDIARCRNGGPFTVVVLDHRSGHVTSGGTTDIYACP